MILLLLFILQVLSRHKAVLVSLLKLLFGAVVSTIASQEEALGLASLLGRHVLCVCVVAYRCSDFHW